MVKRVVFDQPKSKMRDESVESASSPTARWRHWRQTDEGLTMSGGPVFSAAFEKTPQADVQRKPPLPPFVEARNDVPVVSSTTPLHQGYDSFYLLKK